MATVEHFVDPVSLLSKQAFHKLRKKFDRLHIGKEGPPATEGQADTELLEFLANMDTDDDLSLPRGEVWLGLKVVYDD